MSENTSSKKLTCEVSISPEQLRQIETAEAVLLRDYENDAGERWSSFVRCGDAEEMQVVADTPKIFMVPNGLHTISHSVVLVRDLLMPAGLGE